MIKITTYDHREIALNPDLLEKVEAVPETVLTLTNGKKILVYDTMEQVMEKFILYKQLINFPPGKQLGEQKNENQV